MIAGATTSNGRDLAAHAFAFALLSGGNRAQETVPLTPGHGIYGAPSAGGLAAFLREIAKCVSTLIVQSARGMLANHADIFASVPGRSAALKGSIHLYDRSTGRNVDAARNRRGNRAWP